MLFQPVPQNLTTHSWNYSKGNYEAFNNYFQQLDWSDLFNDEVEHNWSVFKEQIFKAQELFIPQFKKKAKPNEVPWLSKEFKTAVKLKQSAFNKYKATNLSVDYESQLIANIKTKPHHFYTYIRRKLKIISSTL